MQSNEQESISTEQVQLHVMALAKRLAEADDTNERSSKAFLWGATALAYMLGAYDNTEFSEAFDTSCEAYDMFLQRARKATA